VSFFNDLASSGQLGTWLTVVCHVFDFDFVSSGGDWPTSSGIEAETGCQNGFQREPVFAAIVC
jgi:hypothetical protein